MGAVSAGLCRGMHRNAIWIAPKIGAMDVPKNDRRVHNKPIPRFGGIAIFAGMMVALATFAAEDKGVPAAMVTGYLTTMQKLLRWHKNAPLGPNGEWTGDEASLLASLQQALQ